MELDALRILAIVIGVSMVIWIVTAITAITAAIRLMRKVSVQLDRAGAVSENVMGFTSGLSRLGLPLMVSRIMLGIARKAFSK